MSIGAYLLAMCLYSLSGAIYFFMAATSYKEGKYFKAGIYFNAWLFQLFYLAKNMIEN